MSHPPLPPAGPEPAAPFPDEATGSPFLDLAGRRRSVRRFRPDPVPTWMIRSCLEAARIAPSAEHTQPWRFIVIADPDLRRRTAEAAFHTIYRFTRWAGEAPVLVAMAAKLDILANRIGAHLQGTQFYLLDLGAAGEHFVLRAAELGLGTCWIGWFDAKRASRVLGLPRKLRLSALFALGFPHPDFTPRPKERRSIDDIAEFR